MARLTAEQRRRLPSSKFAEPEVRKYPVPDKAHARDAKARASQAYNEGRISRAERDRIYARADRMLYGGSGQRGHVYVVDDEGRPRSRVKPDSQPDYKMKPQRPRPRRERRAKKAG